MSYSFIISRESFSDSNVANTKFVSILNRKTTWDYDTRSDTVYYVQIVKNGSCWSITPFYLIDDDINNRTNLETFTIDTSGVILDFLYFVHHCDDDNDDNDILRGNIYDSNNDIIYF